MGAACTSETIMIIYSAARCGTPYRWYSALWQRSVLASFIFMLDLIEEGFSNNNNNNNNNNNGKVIPL